MPASAAAHDRPALLCLERDAAVSDDREAARAAWLRRNVPLANYYRAQGAPLPDWPDGETPGWDAAAPGRAIAGTPDECVRAIERCRDELGCEYLSLMNLGTGPGFAHAGNYEHELRALELFGKEVLPAFR